MPGSTPIYAIPYPCQGENIDCEAFEAWADAIQNAIDLTRVLETQARTRPSARASGTGQAGFVSGANTALVYQTEVYDNNGMVNLAVNNDRFTIQTPGWYLFGTFVQTTVLATTTSVAVGLTQNAVFTFRKKHSPNPINANTTPGVQAIGLMRCAQGDVIQSLYTYTGGVSPVVLNVTMFGYMTSRL